MLQNGSGSKAGRQAKSGKEKVKAKAKGIKGEAEIVKANLCATTGVREWVLSLRCRLQLLSRWSSRRNQKEKGRSNIVTGESRQESEERNHGNGD